MTAASTGAPVEYIVHLTHRHAHLYEVEARFSSPAGGTFDAPLELRLPVWTPGSYLVREFERHVQEVACDDGEGRPLAVAKVDKSTWRVEAQGAAQVRARYRVYAFDLTVRAAHLDDSHGFWNGACLFLYADALRGSPHRVRVIPPEGWRVTVGLDADPVEPTLFTARDYDELVDSPFEVGAHEVIAFEAQGRPHRLAVWGRLAYAKDALVADFVKIIDVAQAVFGDPLPYPDYTFLLMLSPGQYGGLEHARSCTLLTSPFTFHPRKKYEEFLELVSHEFFHLWNVKRIHPEVLGPFDYQREAYTRCLWFLEGVTSYYDRHLLVRAGLQTPKRYLEKLGEELAKITATPGRLKHSLEEASFDAWIKFYRPDENSANSTISYYLKGGVVALLLDLTIRAATSGARSLDDVMRLLWRRYGREGVGFPEGSLEALVVEAAEGAEPSVREVFARWIRGRAELDPAPLLRTVGLGIEPDEDDDRDAWLGATLKEGATGVVVTTVLDGGPGVRAGLYAQDEIVAIDGWRVDLSGLKDRLAARKPGDAVALSLFRRDELRTVTVELGAKPADRLSIVPDVEATAAQRAAFEAWLGQPFPLSA